MTLHISETAWRYSLHIFGALVVIFLIAPTIIFLPLSFSDRALFKYPIEEYSLRWYRSFLGNSEWFLPLFNSLIVAAVATVLASALGVLAAIGLWKAPFPGKKIIMMLIISPMVVPSVVVGVSLYFALARVGLNASYLGLILAHTALASPLVVVTVSATLSRFDANLIRAAESLGADPFVTFRRVTLPLILPGVVTGAIFAFAVSFDDVVTALFISGPGQRTLPVKIYMATSDIADLTTMAAATFMLLIAMLMMASIYLMRRKDRLQPDGGRGGAADGALE